MNDNFSQAQQAIRYAYDALRVGDNKVARRWAGQAAKLAPQLEEPWLILASVSEPDASIRYLEEALRINPDSPRAIKGMAWAQKRLGKAEVDGVKPVNGERRKRPARKGSRAKTRRKFILPALLIIGGCLVVLLAGWTAFTNPAIASMLRAGVPTQVVHPDVWAQVPIAKPTRTAEPVPEVVMAEATATLPPSPMPTVTSAPPTQAPTEVVTDLPTQVPTDIATDLPTGTPIENPTQAPANTSTPEAGATPGQLVMEIIENAPAPTQKPASSSSSSSNGGVRWVEVNLSEQMVYAWQGDTLMNSFLASTGTWAYPTVTGTFKIWNKTPIQAMSGPGYYLPNVPWVMYFYKDYGFHGTYWHNNFGTPMSHGCVNLTIPAAEWLYNFGYVGMTVKVHY
jgi:lipoprotein-anchoring transpeptidase ErfK/SrfK